MLKTTFILILFLCTTYVFAQNNDQGSYKLERRKKAKELPPGKAKLRILFIGPTGKPVTSRIKFAMNKDSIVPVIDETGVYTMQLKAAKYKFNFVAPWWYNVPTDSIKLKSRKVTTIKVRFEAKEYNLQKSE